MLRRVLTQQIKTCSRSRKWTVMGITDNIGPSDTTLGKLLSTSVKPPHFLAQVLRHQDSVALLNTPTELSAAPQDGTTWTYAQLLHEALQVRDLLTEVLANKAQGPEEGQQPRIAFLGARGPEYVILQWAIWLAGAIAVPLHPAHPADELSYILSDSGAAVLIASDSFVTSPSSPAALRDFLANLSISNGEVVLRQYKAPVAQSESLSEQGSAQIAQWIQSFDFDANGAHIVYTSGTTGRPKGVVITHASLTAQIHDVVSAWEMSAQDHLLHFLPLHHTHGILNNLLCVHYAGGSVEFLASAKPHTIWSKLAASANSKPVTMLMAVPTVYMLLLEEMERAQGEEKALMEQAVLGAKNLRVAISGSMACPVSILNRWEALTGQKLLERYGMTELGMALTNPLHGERHFGYVGGPFPSVSVRLVDPETEQEIDKTSEQEGELRVKGPIVFREYWNKPDATAKEFDADGWFKTGDIAQYNNERESFRIRGRASADILKSAGYKMSALDIERTLLTHPQIQECAVFGMPDEKWGQIVSVVIRSSVAELKDPAEFTPPIVSFAKEHMPAYRVPRKYFFVDQIPKNAMGKVNKKALATIFK